MCGITGFISTRRIDGDTLVKMTNRLLHRGPNANSTYISENGQVGLGHTRLSILDLSESANQPFWSRSKRYVMVYNGEVYNYQSLANELDVPIHTTSDTEVIIEAFEKWGVQFVNKLNGMFALAIFDTLKQELFLCRDRLGIKPLFVYNDQESGVILFASELKSIQEVASNYKLDIDYNAIANFLHIGYIPQPQTIYRQVSKFPSGSYALIDEKLKLDLQSYWDIDAKITDSLVTDEMYAEQRLDTLINESVRKRLISDVPFGTFLSGGIDSSLVTAIASKHVTGMLNTFSIGFKESKTDESVYARQVAEHLKTNHTQHILTSDDAKDLLMDLLDTYDEPFADSSSIPTILVSKLAKEQVTMVLSGDGGDELFHGYGMYDWADRLQKTPNFAKKILSSALSKSPNRLKRAAHLFDVLPKNELRSNIFSQEQYLFSTAELERIMLINSKNMVYSDPVLSRHLTAKELQSIFDMKYYLKDDLLVKVDRASMRHGLEVRVPLLDHEIVEFALNLAPQLKVYQGEKKHILKKVLYKYVPQEIFNRPKQGFSIPLQEWLSSDLKHLIDDYLNEDLIRAIGVLDFEMVNTYKKRFQKKDKYLYNRIWSMITLTKFLKEFKQL